VTAYIKKQPSAVSFIGTNFPGGYALHKDSKLFWVITATLINMYVYGYFNHIWVTSVGRSNPTV